MINSERLDSNLPSSPSRCYQSYYTHIQTSSPEVSRTPEIKAQLFNYDAHSSSDQIANPTSAVMDNTQTKTYLERVQELVWFMVKLTALCCVCELLIWSMFLFLSYCSLPTSLSSIFSMFLVFAITSILNLLSKNTYTLYSRHIKELVDFLNLHLSIGFTTPLVLISRGSLLSLKESGLVSVSFLLSNLLFWPFIFVCSFALFYILRKSSSRVSKWVTLLLSPTLVSAVDSFKTRCPRTASLIAERHMLQNPHALETPTPAYYIPYRASLTMSVPPPSPPPPPPKTTSSLLSLLKVPSCIIFVIIVLVGIPCAAASIKEYRVLDLSILAFFWSLTCVTQGYMRQNFCWAWSKKLGDFITTLANPVLWTAMLMTAYIWLIALIRGISAGQHLQQFSSGRTLAFLWTQSLLPKLAMPIPSASSPGTMVDNGDFTLQSITAVPPNWFGAGDVVVALLECGVVIWGFKLYECRRQLWEWHGLMVISISMLMACLNMYVSTGLARLVGLHLPEALAFSTRSTTLALSQPAMSVLGGNPITNAIIVVANGILGQLLYPYVLPRLGIDQPVPESLSPSPSRYSQSHQMMSKECRDSHIRSGSTISIDSVYSIAEKRPEKRSWIPYDDQYHHKKDKVSSTMKHTIDMAAGTAIGINGAAMGVAYLYGRKLDAAPYAVLAMVFSGVITLIIGTMDSSQKALIQLAGSGG